MYCLAIGTNSSTTNVSHGLDSVREFIDRPGNILGSPATKHGEIAEVAEVALRRSWDTLFERAPSADLHPDRIGPIDYIVKGADVQSKFYNDVHNSLGGVAGHLDKHPNFRPATPTMRSRRINLNWFRRC